MTSFDIFPFSDAIREMKKYSEDQENHEHAHGAHLDTQIQMHMRLFRAQRNFYISGTHSILLSNVVDRLTRGAHNIFL